MIGRLTFFVLSICCTWQAAAQLSFQFAENIKVFENDRELAQPFAGGFNSGQYGSIDLDLDGHQDLVVFDRSANKILTFRHAGDRYVYAPEFEYFFPDNIQNWMLLADYDCDGREDLFTYTSLGIRVFRNTGANPLEWESAASPLLTFGSFSLVNLQVNSTDLPSISDLDGDGDLDILTFNFASGGYIEHHQNMSVENSGSCGLDFVRVTREYGDFQECSCDTFVFGEEECDLGGGRTLHAGGKALLAFDQNHDGDKELVVGQENCVDITFLANKGSAGNPIFDEYTNLFPDDSQPVFLPLFPAAFYLDVTFDGLKDVLVAPNLRTNISGLVDFTQSSWLYVNSGSGISDQFTFDQRSFLQDEMIDLNEYSFPAFVDVDGDLDDDLIIANGGARANGQYVSTLRLYSKTPNGLVLSDEDYMSFSLLNFTFINPSFVDVNEDGRLDMLISAIDITGQPGLYFIINSGDGGSMQFDLANLQQIPISSNSLDDVALHDINADGALDLLVAKSNGRLLYYINNGSNLLPDFVLENDSYLGLDFNSTSSNLNLDVVDFDLDGKNDLITTDASGVARIYYDFASESATYSSDFLELANALENRETHLGRSSHPAVGMVDGKTAIAFGNIRGGITLLTATENSLVEPDILQLTVFPNPSNPDKILKFHTPNQDTLLEIFNVSGQKLSASIPLTSNEIFQYDMTNVRNGIYLARISDGSSFRTVRFVLY